MSKIIWIVGSPRSGTSFLTDYIGEYTDHCFNEPWDEFPITQQSNWGFPTGSIVFKYCANALYYEEISNLYPNSKWVHVARNPFHVLYSMNWPKKGSWPTRLWEDMGTDPNTRIKKTFHKWHSIFTASINIKEAKIIRYEDVDIESLAKFIDLPLSREKFTYKNRNDIFEEDKMKLLIELLKTNDLYDPVDEARASLVGAYHKLCL